MTSRRDATGKYLALLPAAAGVILLLLVLMPGCTEISSPPEKNPIPGLWDYNGTIGNHTVQIRFNFSEGGSGIYSISVPDTEPTYEQSLSYDWENEGTKIFMGTRGEQEHMNITYHPDIDQIFVIADNESGIFVGGEFYTGPFYWNFSRNVSG